MYSSGETTRYITVHVYCPERIYDREMQQDSTPVDKYHFSWTTKGVRYYPKFQL